MSAFLRRLTLAALGLVILGLVTVAAASDGSERLAAGAPPAAATRSETQRITVPLTSPGQPAHLTAELVNGSITVEVGGAGEVIVEATPGEEVDEDEEEEETPPQARGMHRLPSGSGLGLEIEEENNRIEIGSNSWNQGVALHLIVPPKTSLELSVVNGGNIVVRGADGEHELSNVNGGIEAVDVTGSVVAETVNGDVTIRLTRLTAGKPLAFTSFNGDVDVTLPAGLGAELRVKTQNGEVFSDFDVALSTDGPRVEQEREGGRYRVSIDREVRGAIGGGGPELRLETFNGDIYLRRK